jgi:RNA-directed DNA polymerase
MLWRWAERRHPKKGRRWIKDKYFIRCGNQKWVFATNYQYKNGEKRFYPLYRGGYVPIRRHIKIRAEANPFLPEWKDYFQQRRIHLLNRKRKESNRYDKEVKLLGQNQMA